MKTIIIGYGNIGQHLYEELNALDPDVYDKYKQMGSPRGRYDFAFICVDTPRTAADKCDVTEVINAINATEADVYVVKSTVLPNKTEGIGQATDGKRIVYFPEFYGVTQHARNFGHDYTILGGERETCKAVVQLLQRVYDGRHRFFMTDAKTAMLSKYMVNSYLAFKVSFCNQFAEVAEKAGVDYEELRELFVADPRINPSHTFVYRDKPYWDSHCFNKDVPAIAEEYGAGLLKVMLDFNKKSVKQ